MHAGGALASAQYPEWGVLMVRLTTCRDYVSGNRVKTTDGTAFV